MKLLRTAEHSSTPWLRLNQTDYRDKNDNVKHWDWVERKGTTRAVNIVATLNKFLVVIKEFRIPINGYEWGFPAGLVDGTEDPEETAARELKEETGLTISKILKVTPFVYNTAGLTNEASSLVYCEAEGAMSRDNLEESEEIETYLLNPVEIREIIDDPGNMIGAKAYIIMDYYARKGVIL